MRKEKKNPTAPRKLDLHRETLHQLEGTSLDKVAGALRCASIRDSCADPNTTLFNCG